MNSYIYTGKLHIEGREIPAMWTAGFSEIWTENNTFNGYRELIDYLHTEWENNK